MTRTDELRRSGSRERTFTDAHAAVVAVVGDDPLEVVAELQRLGEERATAKAQAERLEAEKKILLARISNEIASARSMDKLSEAKIERLAYADPRYTELVEGLRVATEAKERTNAAYWAIQSRLEWLRAILAHENALTRLEG